ncbi:hypothetical protein ACIPZF_04020 [Pseudomonas sp. NPDC089752]|uniref:hypothetical protein n=1 Tax=Pseudomonas sp. NPDC089752 TaxID=3364472 RepID=UPI00381E252A
MSVDNIVQKTLAQWLLANMEKGNGKPHTLPRRDSKEFIVRVQLSYEHHYDQIHDLMEEAGFARTVTTQDGIRRDLPHAMFYRRTEREITNKAVFTAVTYLLEEHAKLEHLRDLNPQIMVMDAKDVYLALDASKRP